MKKFSASICRCTALMLAYLLIKVPFTYAQTSYMLIGSARSASASGCYQLTGSGNGQTGAVWFDKRLDIAESFELTFTINLGSNPAGADGIALVFQTQGNQVLGGQAGGIGYKGIRPSLGIEFDTNQNLEAGDPSEDHMALVRDGVFDHRLNTGFAAPVPISTTQTTVKDGRNHYVKVNWSPLTHILSVQVDCIPRIHQTVDLVNTIFSGTSEVIWGFTSATGARGNAHMVCVLPIISLPDTIQACRNENITFTAPLSFNDTYRWTPSAGLDNSQSRTPHLRVDKSQLYTVQYFDRCAQPKLDSVFVNAKGINFSIGNDRQLCENDSITLKPNITPGSTTTAYRWSTGETTRELHPKTSGQYSLTITADGCSASDTARVSFTAFPELGLSVEPMYDCPGDGLIWLDPLATGTNLRYSWSPGGSQESALMAREPGTYAVQVSTGTGCSVVQKFTIRDNCSLQQVFVPDAFTPNGDGVNDLLEWQGGSNLEIHMKVYDRWGEAIFISTASSPYWNGIYQGKPCPADTYTWLLECRSRLTVKPQTFVVSGRVTLLRYDR